MERNHDKFTFNSETQGRIAGLMNVTTNWKD